MVENGELVKVPIEWKLYEARLQNYAPPIYLRDLDGYISPSKPEAALHLVEGEDLAKIVSEMPKKTMKAIEKKIREDWGVQPEEDEMFLDLLKRVPVIYEPVPRLKDPSILEGMDWRSYVDGLVCPKEGKDPSLISVHRAKLLKPLHLKYAPHSVEITNAGTGKTSFYIVAGIVIDKATSRSVLGYAKSPNEVYPGTCNGTELPTAFDQLESQSSPELARYMFNLMEKGRALVDAGGFRFSVETQSCFSYLGNPIAKNAQVVEGFRALLDHLSFNPALGRRFGIILFDSNLKTIKGSEKMSLTEEEEWKSAFMLFRAVEEYALPKLKQLVRNRKIIEWLHKPIKGYRETIKKATFELKDYNLASFFEAHTEAEHRVRGAALHAAAALLLDKIALDKTSPEEILTEAEELLSDYIEINLDSIKTLAQMWDSLRVDQAKTYFENLPEYLKEIVSATIHNKRNTPNVVKVKLAEIPYEPDNQKAYPYFSKCLNLLKRRKRLDRLNEKLRNYFGFQIERNDDTFSVLYFESPQPPKDLKLIGNFVISSISSFREKNRQVLSPEEEQTLDTETKENIIDKMLDESKTGSKGAPLLNEGESKQLTEKLKGLHGKKGLSEKVTKSRNPRNDEKTEQEENTNCGICGKPLPENLENTTIENDLLVHMDCVLKKERDKQ